MEIIKAKKKEINIRSLNNTTNKKQINKRRKREKRYGTRRRKQHKSLTRIPNIHNTLRDLPHPPLTCSCNISHPYFFLASPTPSPSPVNLRLSACQGVAAAAVTAAGLTTVTVMVFVATRVTTSVRPSTIGAEECGGQCMNNAWTESVTALPMRPRGQLFRKTRRTLH